MHKHREDRKVMVLRKKNVLNAESWLSNFMENEFSCTSMSTSLCVILGHSCEKVIFQCRVTVS